MPPGLCAPVGTHRGTEALGLSPEAAGCLGRPDAPHGWAQVGPALAGALGPLGPVSLSFPTAPRWQEAPEGVAAGSHWGRAPGDGIRTPSAPAAGPDGPARLPAGGGGLWQSSARPSLLAPGLLAGSSIWLPQPDFGEAGEAPSQSLALPEGPFQSPPLPPLPPPPCGPWWQVPGLHRLKGALGGGQVWLIRRPG